MSKKIIAAIRKNGQLHGSLFLSAIELAHRADDQSGIVRMSYSLLAGKCHQSRRTAIRHINRLINLGIISCQRFWGPKNAWGINLYRFRITWERPAQKGNGDKMASTLPNPEKGEERRGEEGKEGSLEGAKKSLKLILSWLTPGSALEKLLREEL